MSVLTNHSVAQLVTCHMSNYQFISFKRHSKKKLRKTFSKFYRRHNELISKYNVGLKTLLNEGLSEPEFYGDLVYKFKKLI